MQTPLISMPYMPAEVGSNMRHSCTACPYIDEHFHGHCLYFGDSLCRKHLMESGVEFVITKRFIPTVNPANDSNRAGDD